jgi:soluble lytic murein transglycosylase-like protein
MKRPRALPRMSFRLCSVVALAIVATGVHAGAQREEALSSSVQASLHRAVSDYPAPKLTFASPAEGEAWLQEMSRRLATKIPDWPTRRDFLITVQYEATRAGLDPQLVLGLIEHESNFHKFAVSSAGALGYMQIMPFWKKQIGNADHNLFNLRTNLRYGCIILRRYLDVENGYYFSALGRYNGSLGRAEYPTAVLAAWRNWLWTPPTAPAPVPGARAAQAPATVVQ